MRLLLAVAFCGMLVSCERAKPPRRDDPSTLLRKLKDPDPVIRQGAAVELGRFPGQAKGIIPDLTLALGDENPEVRYLAASSLRVLHAADADSVRALGRTLKEDPVSKVRAAAAKALRDAAQTNGDALPMLVEPMIDEDSEVRRYATEALQVHSPQAEALLLGALGHSSAALRETAVKLLFPEPRGVAWGLANAVAGHRNPAVRAVAALELGRMGPAAADAVPALWKAVDDVDLDVRLRAIHALGEIGPAARNAIEALTKASKDEALRLEAELALFRIRTPDAPSAEAVERVVIGSRFRKFNGIPCSSPGGWPGFRGRHHTNIGGEDVPLADRWPPEGPRVVWSIDVGEGYAGAAVADGRVFVPDYDVRAKEESLRCFSLDSGKELWRRGHQITIANNHAYTRSVPAVSGKFVVSIGPKCHVMCVDAESGSLKWSLDLRQDYGTVVPMWYAGQCPLIDGTTAVLAPCGVNDLMLGIDCATGKILWRTPNPAKLQMSHSSVVPMTLDGKKMYLYCAEWGKLVGVSADKEDAGRLLWEATACEKQIMVPSPLVLENGFIFMTAPVGAGSALLQVVAEEGTYRAKTLWKSDDKKTLASEMQTPIYHERHIFGMGTISMGPLKEQFLCIDPYAEGRIVWSSGKEKRFGTYEPYLLADGKLIVLTKSGHLVMVKATTEKYEELARFKIHDSYEAFAPMALVGGRLILRNTRKLICVDLAE